MAMVLQDSMAYIEPGLPGKSDSAGTLYLFSDNQLQIASSAGKNARLDVTISQGTIEKKGQYFIAKPTNLGEVQIKVTVLKDDLITEIDSVIYKVEFPPLPQIELPGESAGTISHIKFNGAGPVLFSGIAGNDMPYQLKQFSISPERDLVNEAISDGDKISAQQILMIKKLTPGSKIYIHNVVFIDPDGNLHKGISREVIITD
jgi:hypothetical protein